MIRWLGLVAAMLALPAAASGPGDCNVHTKPGQSCRCDAGLLRPLQGALGFAEVRAKQAQIVEDPDKAYRHLLADPIAVVHGPDGALYIVDHHHGADAWRLSTRRRAVCRVAEIAVPPGGGGFWAGLRTLHLVRLADQDGRAIAPAQLPRSLAAMPDDPYRSLAGLVRQHGGFCRAAMQRAEFAEFVWADWLRGRAELPRAAVTLSDEAVLPEALALVHGEAARGVSGYLAAGQSCGNR